MGKAASSSSFLPCQGTNKPGFYTSLCNKEIKEGRKLWKMEINFGQRFSNPPHSLVEKGMYKGVFFCVWVGGLGWGEWSTKAGQGLRSKQIERTLLLR